MARSSLRIPFNRERKSLLGSAMCVLLMLACGGGRTPLNPGDDGQGSRRLRTDAGLPESPDVRDIDRVPAAAAIHLTVSTDDPWGIHLDWTVEGRVGLTGYLVRRDDQDLVVLDAPAYSFSDFTSEPGAVSAVATLSATQGTRTDAVALSWSAASTVPGTSHIYQVIALDGQSRAVASEKVTGSRAAPTLQGYEFSRDDGVTWQSAGTGTSYDDTGAPLGLITAQAEARARYPLGYVRLQVMAEPKAMPHPPSNYRVRATASSGSGPVSPRAYGFRGVGTEVSYQWQRSAADRDADYKDLEDVTGSLWFDDTAPLDETRFYRAVLRADGATGVTPGAKATVKSFKGVSVGYSHSCAIASDGQRFCWGSYGAGQAPPEFSKDSYRMVVAGWSHEVTCGIRQDNGAVECWGNYNNGSPRITPPTGSFRSISIGDSSGASFLCGILTDGSVYCPIAEFSGPLQAISAGSLFACAVLADGSRVCSGTNNRGQAPPGPSTEKFRSIGAGDSFACGLRTDDTISCWGQISPRFGTVASPVGTFKSLSVGRNAVCALDSQGKVLCLGLAAPATEWKAPREAQDAIFTEVSAGNASACGVRADGKIVCWGQNLSRSAPQPPSKERFASISVSDMLGVNNSTICGIRMDGTLRCWGAQIRIPDDRATQRFKAFNLGAECLCGIREDDKLVCWGDNSDGQTPVGPSSESFSAVSMSALDTCALATNGKITCWGKDDWGEDSPPDALFATLSMGYDFGCGLNAEGKILCWGDNRQGQTHPPEGRFTAVSAGKSQACGLDADHHVVCWGQTSSVSPPAETFKTVSAKITDTWTEEGLVCGVRSDDRVVCWGKTLNADTPSHPTLDRFLDVQAGTCGIRTDHHIICWGDWFGL